MFTTEVTPSRTALSVLIVDDDPLLGDYIGLQVEALGCVPHVVETAQDALDMLRREPVHLLITDWRMPGMDGMELVKAARRAIDAESHLHIAMMTARGEESVIRAAMEAGIDDFLFKPIHAVELELVIKSAARNRLLHHRLMRRNELISAAHQRVREALERVETDLAAATALHERLLPGFDRLGSLELAHFYRPAAILGGDSIGVSPLREDGLLFFIIDVCGHGVPAALDSFHLHHRIKQLRPTSAADLGTAMATINREVCERGDDSYATVVCGLVLPEKGEGWLVCAGHPPPLLVTGDGVNTIEGGRGMPIGWFEDAAYEPVRFAFPGGARLVLYSDGITEAADMTGQEFGLEGLRSGVANCGAAPLGELPALLERALNALRPDTGFDDDISLLAIGHGDATHCARKGP